METPTVHGMSLSGNCYKVRLLLELLGRPYRWRELTLAEGETHTPEFLALNPAGKVPVLELADGRCLPESNAILCYLGVGTRFLPDDEWQRAQVMRWLFFEQHGHERYVAEARFIRMFLPGDHPRRADLPNLLESGRRALGLMDDYLDGRDYFAGDNFTIADIALYAYTHCAGDGGFDLAAYPRVGRWLARVAERPGFVAMKKSS